MLLGVFLPIFNFLLLVLYGRRLGQVGTIYFISISIIITCIMNGFNFWYVVFQQVEFFFKLAPWIQVGAVDIAWEFRFDFLAVCMLLMVSLISGVVHFYSFSYMKKDPHFIRFMSYLSIFTFFMFVLVSAANLVVLFVGWEGVGICSYLLINFWYTRVQANKAAIKALIMNRIGDIGFLLGTVLLFHICQTVDFSTLSVLLPACADYDFTLFHNTWVGNITAIDIICFCFFVGVAGKSAQLGLHTWLPAAMEGPTPVSALIHAATMVTAGIFLLIRCSFLFECSLLVRNLIVILGALTAVISAITACVLYDIKKIIAYSTCSQLGYMAVACGLSQYTIGFFHLINHAFFKALLFLTAGAIIHSFNNEQDIRKLFNIGGRAPLLHACMSVGSIAIMGLPFLSGFYSKDLIIEITAVHAMRFYIPFNFLYSFIILATMGTAFYSFRLYYFLFLRSGNTHYLEKTKLSPLVQPFFMQLSLVVLLLGSIFSGYFLQECFNANNIWSVGISNDSDHERAFLSSHQYTKADRFIFWLEWEQGLPVGEIYNLFISTYYPDLVENVYLENELLPWFIKLLPFFYNLLIIICGLVGLYYYEKQRLFNTTEWLYLSWVLKKPLQNKISITPKTLTGALFLIIKYFEPTILAIKKLCYNNFYFNEVYNFITYLSLVHSFTNVFLNLDKGAVEWLGPTKMSFLYFWFMKFLKRYYRASFATIFFSLLYTLVFFIILLFFFL